jgi:hypothetical protein
MQVKALERLIASRGVDASKADAITRKLRESGHLPLGGRGPNAPRIGSREAATLLIAVAGSSKAADASTRVEKLADLQSRARANSLLDAVEKILSDPAERDSVREVRIARTRRRAVIIRSDHSTEEFRPKGKRPQSGRFFVEGILDNEFLSAVADALAPKSLEPKNKGWRQ